MTKETTGKKHHYFLLAGYIVFAIDQLDETGNVVDGSGTGEGIFVQAMVRNNKEYVSMSSLVDFQIALQQKLWDRVNKDPNIKKEQVKLYDITIVSQMYMGHMSEAQFNDVDLNTGEEISHDNK